MVQINPRSGDELEATLFVIRIEKWSPRAMIVLENDLCWNY